MAFAIPLVGALAAGGGASLLGAGLTTALSVGGAALTGISAIQNGHYQAAVLRNNAAMQEQNAARLSEASQEEAKRSDIAHAALLGEQLAAQGASGLDILGRSQRSVRQLTERVGARAGRDIIREGQTGIRNLQMDAASMRGEAKQAVRQGYVTAAGAALNAASSFVKSGSLATRAKKRMPWDSKPKWSN